LLEKYPPKNEKLSEKDGFTPTQTFAYDAAGNRLKTTDNGRVTEYVANANNQYTAISEDGAQHEPDYDKSGNLLHDATRKFTWDADIHLLSVETTTESGAPRVPAGLETPNPKSAIKESFRYDALHRRVARTESASGTTTLFIHDGWNVIAEYQESAALERAPQSSPGLQPAAASPSDKAPVSQAANADGLKPKTTFLAARHVWGEDLSRTLQGAGGIGGLLASMHFAAAENAHPAPPNTEHRTLNTALFASYDSNGNVLLLTDALCRPAAQYRYDAFGQTISATGPAAQLNRYRFSTKPMELASSLAYYGYRYYDPRTGRWPSRDPIEEMGGINIYTMTQNNAVGNTDALGLFLTGCSGPPPPVLCCKAFWTITAVTTTPALGGAVVFVAYGSTFTGNDGGPCCPNTPVAATTTGTVTGVGLGAPIAVGDAYRIEYWRKPDGTIFEKGAHP
jgi:RHS repeat-associated protein